MPPCPAPSGARVGEPTDVVLDRLARAGNHPLMYSFPQGAVFTFDPELRYLAAGGLGLADVGLSRELLEGRTIFEVFPPGTVAAIEPHYRRALAGESTTVDVAFQGRIYSQRLAPVRDSSGTVVAGLGFTQDVTDARAAERALRDSEQRNRLTFDHAPIGEALVELDGRWRQVNSALCRLTGYPEARLLTMTFQDITHPEDLEADLEQLQRLVRGEIASYQIEKRYFTASSAIVWVLLSVALVRGTQGEPLYLVAQIQDISEQKRQQEALHDFTAMLAHDLRTPVTAIAGFADLLATSWEQLDDDARLSLVHRVQTASRSMRSLLENSLTTSILDAGGLEASPSRVRVDQAVHEVLSSLAADLPEVDTRLLGPCEAWVDRSHLIQVLGNLFTNAIKYGGNRLTIEAQQDDEATVLTVSDNGPGVEPDFVPHLFDRFTRSPRARTGVRAGSGLGLYIVRDLLELNHAGISYSGSPEGGATFVLRLPRRDSAGPTADG